MKHSIEYILKRYNNLLNDRESLKTVNPYCSVRAHYYRSGRGNTHYKIRILQLKRQVERNIKRIENVITKLYAQP